MKIRDLLEAQFNTEVKPDKRYHGRLRSDGRSEDQAATGPAFSKVKDIKNEPHMVRKYNHHPMDPNARKRRNLDGFNFFITQLIERQETDNIHFPRVYSVQKITDNDGKFIHTYDVEKLLPGFKIPTAELLKICTESFGEDDDTGEYTDDDLQEIILGKIIYAVTTQDYGDIKSETLLEALRILHDIVKDAVKLKRGHNFDLHMDNVMYRKTPYGTQLVINDPIA